MNKVITCCSALLLCGWVLSHAQTVDYVFVENFTNLDDDDYNPTSTDMMAMPDGSFDNPNGWDFHKASLGNHGIILDEGGSLTLPCIDALNGNAVFNIILEPYLTEDPSVTVSADVAIITGGGQLSVSSMTGGGKSVSVTPTNMPRMYDVTPQSRLCITAHDKLKVTSISIRYGSNEHAMITEDPVKFSHKTGEYYQPFDLIFTNAKPASSHSIYVYTTDGSEPTRFSPRYDGAIRISDDCQIIAGEIYEDGFFAKNLSERPRFVFPKIDNPEVPENTFTVTVNEPGMLRAAIADIDADLIEGLVIKGKLNSEDLVYLREPAGRLSMTRYLDLSNITLDYDGGSYASVVFAPEAGMGHTTVYTYFLTETASDELGGSSPTITRYNCRRNNLAALFYKHNVLEQIILPDIMVTTGIGEFFVGSCTRLQKVIIPEGVTSVGSYAFNCSATNMNLPNTLTKIGDGAFAAPFFGQPDLSLVTEIGYGAFRSSNISSVKLGIFLRHIGDEAFEGSKLLSIVIPDQIDSIHPRTFAGCEYLQSVKLPSNLTYVGIEAFYGTPFVETIKPENGIRYIGATAYELVDTEQTSYTVKSGCKIIGERLFADAVNMTTVSLPEGLESIGDDSFSNLTSLELPSTVKYIGRNAFSACGFPRVTIPEHVEFIGSNAFSNDRLWNVTYNAINAKCDFNAFSNRIERISLGEQVKNIPSYLYTNNESIQDVILPNTVESISEEAFRNCVGLRSVTCSDRIKHIAANAFADCVNLRTIHWPLGLETVGDYAFNRCSSLSLISLPEGVTGVGNGAFSFCESVKTLYIPSTLTEVAYGAFTLYNNNAAEGATITCTASNPFDYEWSSDAYMKIERMKVPNSSINAYKSAWPSLAGVIEGIDEITAPKQESNTTFASVVNSETDLSDAVIGDVYVTVGDEDSYDTADGSIVLNSTMSAEDAEAIGGMAPGKSDIANRFNGLVVFAPSAQGTINIDCQTIGAKRLSVKVGENKPEYFVKTDKGSISVKYDINEDTYIYIYGSDNTGARQTKQKTNRSMAASSDCIRIYSVGINPTALSLGDMGADSNTICSEITDYYTLDGIRIDTPTRPGIYIIRYADGTIAKMVIK